MPDIDLGPNDYREKGKRVIRYVSSRPFKIAAVLCGVWAAGIWYTFRHWLPLDPPWALMPIALFPSAILMIMSLLFLHEGTAEPPERPRGQRSQHPKRERPPRQQDLRWKIYRED